MKTLTSSCRPSRTSSTHLLPLALYHLIWRQPSSNLCWKRHHLTKTFWKTTVPFLTYLFCPKFLKKSFSTNFSPISKKTTSAIPFSQPIKQDAALRPFCYVLKTIFFPLWTMTTFLFFFCWIFLPLLTLLTTKFSSPAWTLFLACSLLHSSGFTHTSQTGISPLQSITRLRHHHSSCTVCLRAQYWGPFSSSCTPLSDIVANHSVNHQLFADDTQLQKSAPLNEVTNLTKELNACTDNIKTWMTENQLKLNDDKTEALLFPFSSSLKPSTVPLPDSITLGSHNIPFSDSARNLGFILDSKLSMKKHIIKICQTAYFELKRISSIRRFLTEDATKTIVTSYILSRLDYCNCLLMGTPNSVIQPLQKIQNFAARLVLLAPRHHHATPLLEKLHWLPISERIKYKVACMCFSTINGSGPAYLSELLHVYTPSRTLRSSSDTRMLEIQQYKRKTHGFRTFSCFGPHIWNSLPQDLRHCSTLSSFKAKLKTFLFSLYFHPN